jgi:putative spermidine/putrescine transport system substrate-binding protein
MTSETINIGNAGKTRRSILKGLGAAAGAVAGSGVITGFPTIWAQNIKNVTLVHVGSSYSAIKDIAVQATKDLGFKIEMQNLNGDKLVERVIKQPNTIDIADIEFWAIQKIFPLGIMQGINTKKIKNWSKMASIFTTGKYPDGKEVSRQGTAPFKVQYTSAQNGKDFVKGVSDFATIMVNIYNGDTLGIRPDLIKRPITTWGELFNPEFKGKSAIVDIPSVGIMDIAMAFESLGVIKYGDKGNMTKAELDKTFIELTKLKKQGQFRALWSSFDQSVNLMASGDVVIQPMWSPAITAIRARNIECKYMPLKEGYRAWGVGLGIMSQLEGIKLDAAYEYLNWYQSGWQGAFAARQGYYSPVLETTKAALKPAEWDYWYDGKPAATNIVDPYGNPMEKAGAVRDGGSYSERMGNIACWNTVMTENDYMIAKWNEFRVA